MTHGVAFQKVIGLSEAMLAAARVKDFDRLAELEKQRRPLLCQWVNGNPPRGMLRSALQQIQRLDQAILVILEQEREQAARELRKIRTSRKAVRMYTTIMDDMLVDTDSCAVQNEF